MTKPVSGFLIGLICGVIVLAGVLSLRNGAEPVQAQEGTWQVQYWSDVAINGGSLDTDPDRFIDDWVRALPADCDIVPMSDVRNVLFYRCP